MNSGTAYFIGIVLTAAISFGVVIYMKAYLTAILVDLCGTIERAKFWMAFTNVMVLFTPVVFAMHFQPDPYEQANIAFQLSRQLEWALVGMLGALLIVGFVLARFIEQAARQPRLPSFAKDKPTEA